jgi:hypothetical protein
VLFGQQTGRLASDEDKSDFANRCSSRQEFELTPMLEEFITRMQAAGIIDSGEFEIEWPPVNAPTEKDKVDLLGKMTAAMQQAYQAGLTEPLFDANELRAVVDYEQRKDDGMPTEDDPARTGDVDPQMTQSKMRRRAPNPAIPGTRRDRTGSTLLLRKALVAINER